jgi:hypothetical protein
MVDLLMEENYRSLALRATRWLGQLVQPEKIMPRSEWWPRNVVPVLDALERKYHQGLGRELRKQVEDQLLPLENLPAAFEHRDFSAWNILISEDGAISVLDWDEGEPDGILGMDLVFFLTTLALLHEGALSTGQIVPAYRKAQDPGSFTGAVHEECLRNYFEKFQLDPLISQRLRLLAWAYHSLAEQPRIASSGGSFETENANPFIQLLIEDLGMAEPNLEARNAA